MKKLLTLLILCFSFFARADDTAALQAMLNSGNTTLPPGHAAYNVINLNVVHSFNINGNTINFNGTNGVIGMQVSNPGIKISNGTFTGLSSTYNQNGASCIRLSNSNDSVVNCIIQRFTGAGILQNAGNSPYISGNTIQNTGYVGYYYIPNANTLGGKFINNTVDRSMLSPTTVQQSCVLIRASVPAGFITTGWVISGNTLKMPSNPTNPSSECMEIRNIAKSTVHNNSFVGGSIGNSLAGGNNIAVSLNTCTDQNQESIEIIGTNCRVDSNTIVSSRKWGFLFDGATGSQNITCTGNVINNCVSNPINISSGCYNIYFFNNTIANANTSNGAINIQRSYGIFSCNNTITGSNVAYIVDTSPGTVYICGGSIASSMTKTVNFFANTPIVMNNVIAIGLVGSKGYSSVLSNGATLGSNISIP